MDGANFLLLKVKGANYYVLNLREDFTTALYLRGEKQFSLSFVLIMYATMLLLCSQKGLMSTIASFLLLFV